MDHHELVHWIQIHVTEVKKVLSYHVKLSDYRRFLEVVVEMVLDLFDGNLVSLVE